MKKFFTIFYSQIFNAFFPVLIVSLLLKIPQKEYAAVIFLIMNLSNVYLLFSDYSSNITFLKDALMLGGIGGGGENVPGEIVKKIEGYLGIKILILAVGFSVWVFLCISVPLLQKSLFSNILAYTFIIAYNLNFYWVYMSSNKEYFFILSNFASRTWLLLLLLSFPKFNISFFYLMPAAGFGSMAITAIFFVRFTLVYKIKITINRKILIDGWRVVKNDSSLVANSFLLMVPSTCLSLFIGFVKSVELVVVYGLAEKIFTGIRSLLSVFVNSLYPVLCKPGAISRKKLTLIYLLFYTLLLTGSALLYFLAPFIVSYFALPPSHVFVFTRCLLYFILTLLAVSLNVPMFVRLLVENRLKSRKALKFLSATAILIVSIFTAEITFNNGVIGIVQSILASETLIVLAFFLLLKTGRSRSTSQTIVPTL